MPVTTAVQTRDKCHEKVKFNKIDITFDTLRPQNSFRSQNAQKYQNYICFLRTFFRKPNSICGFWKNWFLTISCTIKSSTFSIGFRGISQLGSAFIFLRWFKLAHICIQVTSLHKWKKQGINHKLLIGNRFHVTLRIVSPIILLKYNLYYSVYTRTSDEKVRMPDEAERVQSVSFDINHWFHVLI